MICVHILYVPIYNNVYFILQKSYSVPTDQLGSQKLQKSDILKLRRMYKCCENKRSDSSCEYWAGKGYCAPTHRYGNFMKGNCGQTCKNDKNKQSCGYWAGKGFCAHTYVPFMKDNCAKTCGGKC